MTGAEFKAARKELGLTVRDMAASLRLSEANGERIIRRWERGEVDISGPASVAVEAMLKGFDPEGLLSVSGEGSEWGGGLC